MRLHDWLVYTHEGTKWPIYQHVIVLVGTRPWQSVKTHALSYMRSPPSSPSPCHPLIPPLLAVPALVTYSLSEYRVRSLLFDPHPNMLTHVRGFRLHHPKGDVLFHQYAAPIVPHAKTTALARSALKVATVIDVRFV